MGVSNQNFLGSVECSPAARMLCMSAENIITAYSFYLEHFFLPNRLQSADSDVHSSYPIGFPAIGWDRLTFDRRMFVRHWRWSVLQHHVVSQWYAVLKLSKWFAKNVPAKWIKYNQRYRLSWENKWPEVEHQRHQLGFSRNIWMRSNGGQNIPSGQTIGLH